MTPQHFPAEAAERADEPWPNDAAASIQALIDALIPDDQDRELPTAFNELNSLLSILERQRETGLELARDASTLVQAKSGHGPADPFPIGPLLLNRLEALKTEGNIQAVLGQLPEPDLRMLQSVLDHALAGTPLASEYCLANLVIEDAEHQHVQPGVVVIARTRAFKAAAVDSAWLIYWPGRNGELAWFQSRQALEDALVQFLFLDGEGRIRLVPSSLALFEHGLQAQLQDAQARAAALPLASPESTEALLRLREELIEAIQLPEVPARALAMHRVQELWRSLAFARNIEGGLAPLSGDARKALKTKILEYLEAAAQVEHLRHRELPARELFARQMVSARLIEDFSLSAPCDVLIDIPVEVGATRELISGSGAPGTPYHLVPTPSAEREVVALNDLALVNIDEAMAQRLTYLRVSVTPTDHPQREALLAGTDKNWIKQAIHQLDLAQQYEDRLYRFFKRTDANPDELDQELSLLRRPFELLFELQSQVAGALGILDDAGQAILAIASHARTPDSWMPSPYNVQVRPVLLTLFDEGVQHRGANLSGVNFITDTVSGVTVLMLPSVPGGKILSQYPNLDAARDALADLCLDGDMAAYIAERAVSGDPAWLKARIGHALSVGFRALFTAGNPWPKTTSLAQHLVDSQMGEAIKAHRDTSRSNHELAAVRRGIAQEEVFDHLKMVMGFVPVLGTGIALVEAGYNLYRAAEGFVEGDAAKGFAHFESTLLSVTDGLMDLLPGIPLSLRMGRVRVATRARHLQETTLGSNVRCHELAATRSNLDRSFQGYEANISLSGLRPGVEGRWQGIYEHKGHSFIQRKGVVMRTQWDADLQTWRLAPTRFRTYRQAITLDANGQWQTHGAVYGTLINGGLQGGGGVLGTLVDHIDPHLPRLLRQHLPRWFTDAGYRRLQRLKGSAEAAYAAFLDQHKLIASRFDAISGGPGVNELDALDDLLIAGIKRAEEVHRATGEYLPLSSGRFKRELTDRRNKVAAQVANYSNRRAQLCNERIRHSLSASDEAAASYRQLLLRHTMGTVTRNQYVTQGRSLVEGIRQGRLDRLGHFERAEQLSGTIDHWGRQVNDKTVSKSLHPIIEEVLLKFASHQVDFVRAQHLLSLILIEQIEDLSLQALNLQFGRVRLNIASNLSNLHHAADLKLGQAQRRAIIEQANEAFASFAKRLKHWEASYPGLIDAQAAQQLDEVVTRIKLRAERKIQDMPAHLPKDTTSRKRVLTTVEGHILIAEPETPAGDIMRAGDVDSATRYRKTQDNRWEPIDLPATPTGPSLNANEIKAEAQKRLRGLTNFTRKAEGYARQGMAPADLEDLMVAERNELLARAQRLRALPFDTETSALIEELRQAASELTRSGKALRVAQIKRTATPTAGYLDYLMEQQQVRILKVGGLEEITVAGRGRREFLQEYEILDIENGQTLWYAHFHYENSDPTLYDLLVAHLKRPDQRRKGLRWQQGQGDGAERIWRGLIPRGIAFKYFEDL